MPEITVRDLLSWEPRFRLGSGSSHEDLDEDPDPALFDREVTWAVTLRASMPILPPLRGGEVVILPDRILHDAGVPTGEIVREVAARGATGVIVERFIPLPPSLIMISIDMMPADLESDINRMLTEQRGEIYRSGTELGRILTQTNAVGADMDEVLRVSSENLGFGAAVLANGDVIAVSAPATASAVERLPVPAGVRGWQGDWFGLKLAGGNLLWLGPVPPERRALARLVSERIGMAVEAAHAHARDVRPRGSARPQAIAGLLTEAGTEAGKVGSALGLPSTGSYIVAMAPASVDRLAMQRELASLGAVHDAADVDGFAAALIEAPARSARAGGTVLASGATRRTSGSGSEPAVEWIAVSEVVNGVAHIPAAAKQSRYLAALISAGMLEARMLRYDRPSDVGVYRLLFPLWGSRELEGFARDTLGALLVRDRRGLLRRTLLAYLEAGGSQVDASAALGVHRNTLAYRLKQIAELTGADPNKPQSHLALHMALLVSVLPVAPGSETP